jgi:hypothetical protein
MLYNKFSNRLEKQMIHTFVKLIHIVCLFICLFPCHYNPLWVYFHSPIAGFSLLVFEVS